MKLDQAFGIHPQALFMHARRSEVLASNIANADTPDYKARDFDFQKVLQNETRSNVRMKTTAAAHIQPHGGVVAPSEMAYRVPNQASLDGNTVDTQTEHSEYAANALQYQASLSFINGAVSSLRKAIRGD